MSIKEEFVERIKHIQAANPNYTKLAVVGQPGAGKSSLINNLVGQKVAATGQETDVTVTIEEYDFCYLKLVDLPGYGTERFQYAAWSQKFDLGQFDAFLYVFSGKFTEDDDKLFAYFRTVPAKPVLMVRNHSNSLATEEERKTVENDVEKHFGKTMLYFVDCGRYKEGIEELRRVCLEDRFLELWKQRLKVSFAKEKQIYLEAAYKQAEEKIGTYKKLAAVNGLNPVLGADVAVDLTLYYKMFSDIREAYGIAEADFKLYLMVPIANEMLQLLTKEGVTLLLKNFSGRLAAKTVSKYIPFVGQAVAVTLGWQLCKMTGDDYNSKCREFASETLDEEIDKALAEVNC